jgi:hypothetical protein
LIGRYRAAQSLTARPIITAAPEINFQPQG